MTLDRRKFLGLTGSAVGTAATGGLIWRLGSSSETDPQASPVTSTSAPVTTTTTTVGQSSTTTVVPKGPRTLVVVQMSGGNDGLNTLVPDDGRYRDARPTLAIDEASLVKLAGVSGFGLHPGLEPLGRLWDGGEMAIVQGMALPEQTRSHFVALDTWWAATPELAAQGGWLGRWLDLTSTDDSDPLRAVSLGGGSPALNGVITRPVTIGDLDGFALAPPRGSRGVVDAFSAMALPSEDGLWGQVQGAIPIAVDSVGTLQSAIDGQPSDARSGVETLFDAAASIIAADIGTEIIVINVPGFDTHSDQLRRHQSLMEGVANGVAEMYRVLAEADVTTITTTMAFSEFGRRVEENGSGGTDHGHAGLGFLFGPAVAGAQVVGDVDLGDLDRGDLRPSIDSRSMYADVLDWLGGPTEQVLGGRYESFSLLS